MDLSARLETWVNNRFEEEAPFLLAQLRAFDVESTGQDPERILTALAVVGADQGVPTALELGRIDWRDLLVAAGLAGEDWRDALDEMLRPPG